RPRVNQGSSGKGFRTNARSVRVAPRLAFTPTDTVMNFKHLWFACFAALLACGAAPAAADRPNVLWITSEDNSPYLGCYGDALAQTPRLDKLAGEGVRYRNAFANSPVCSAARSALIVGMHGVSAGLHNHRSRVAI